MTKEELNAIRERLYAISLDDPETFRRFVNHAPTNLAAVLAEVDRLTAALEAEQRRSSGFQIAYHSNARCQCPDEDVCALTQQRMDLAAERDAAKEENRRALALLRQFVERLGHDEHCDCLICYDLEDTIKDAKALLAKDEDDLAVVDSPA